MKNKIIIFLSTFTFLCVFTFSGISLAAEISQSEPSPNNYKTLPNSLLITTPNIDPSSIIDNRPLFDEQKNLLFEKGYSKSQVDLMTIEDYNNLKKTWKLKPETIKSAKFIYPELEDVDISNWTFGEFEDYSSKIDNNTYAPSPDNARKLAERNITLADARYLLKEFYSYENILKQTDIELKDVLQKRNQFNLDFVNYVSRRVIPEASTSATPPPEYLHRYVRVYMPGYGTDYFHVYSGTSDPYEAAWQSEKAKRAFMTIYNVPISQTPQYGNMWGTYSASSNGAHEGIDMNYLQKPPVYSVVNGVVRSASGGIVRIYDDTVTYDTVFYNHLSQINVGIGDIEYYERIGNQGDVGAVKGQYHVHLQIESGDTAIQNSARDNHDLDSSNPYVFIEYNW